jgi:hypothetical protein
MAGFCELAASLQVPNLNKYDRPERTTPNLCRKNPPAYP